MEIECTQFLGTMQRFMKNQIDSLFYKEQLLMPDIPKCPSSLWIKSLFLDKELTATLRTKSISCSSPPNKVFLPSLPPVALFDLKENQFFEEEVLHREASESRSRRGN